jgi:hypothetical protein
MARILRLKALADQPALHIGEGDDNSVDLARSDGFAELIERQLARHGVL